MSEQVAAIYAELEAQTRYTDNQCVVQIRIEPKAPPGGIVALPMSGEIAERFKARGVLEPREILISPDDWRELMKTATRISGLRADLPLVTTTLNGIPVIGA